MKRLQSRLFFFLFILVLLGSVGSVLAANCPGGYREEAGVCFPNIEGMPDPGGDDPVIDVAMNVMNFLLEIFGVLAVIAFVISGIMYLTAAGDEGRMEMGKKTMIWSIVGIVIGLGGLVIIKTIDAILK